MLCIFLTGGAYAPYANCMATPLVRVCVCVYMYAWLPPPFWKLGTRVECSQVSPPPPPTAWEVAFAILKFESRTVQPIVSERVVALIRLSCIQHMTGLVQCALFTTIAASYNNSAGAGRSNGCKSETGYNVSCET